MDGANLGDMRIFVAVAEAGSFAAGGKAGGLSRSAAGKAVARLEARLGVRLLSRTTRRLSLTEEGRVYLDEVRQALQAVERAEASVARGAGRPRGVLRLTVPDAYGRRVLLPLVADYMAQWPEVQVEMSFGDRVSDLVGEGFDLAVRLGVTTPNAGLVMRRVASFAPLLCASPEYLATRGAPEAPGSLEGHDALHFASAGTRQAWRYRDAEGVWQPLAGKSRLRLDSAEALREAALAGRGVALLPDFLVSADIASGHLRQVLPALDLGTVPVVTLYPERRMLEPRVRRFIDLMAERLPGLKG